MNSLLPTVPRLRRRAPLNVLVAEDDDASREELRGAVLDLGHACTTAREGAEAWELHCEKGFDVILSDWLMPYMDGLELCKRARAETGDGYTYFIMLTSLTDREHVVEALREGVDDYLTKPLDLEQLQAKLQSAARITQLHRGLSKSNATLKRAGDRAFSAARTDPLTKVGNRLRLQDDLASLRAVSRYGHLSSAALCDVDNFKLYNDRFGHLAGDEALRKLAASMRASLREGDALYRYGGDEFLVILPEQSPTEAGAAMERVRRDIERLAIPHDPKTATGVVTISVGVSALAHASDAAQLDSLRRADAALYRAKAAGQNRVELNALDP